MGKGSSGNQSYQVFQANEPVAVEQSLNEREPYVRGYTLIATVQAKNLSSAVEKSNSRDGNGWVNRKPQALGVGERETGRGDVIVDSRGQSYRYDQYRLTKHNHRLVKGFRHALRSPMVGTFFRPLRHLPFDHSWVDPISAVISALILHLPE
jgi:hypothetical protein